ncbi:MAG: hypothetical protein AAGI53_17105 [Planctomycetota bacterium]
MTKTTFNLTQAGRVIGKSRATIQRALASGKLSYELDEHQNRVVRADELIRVYGDQTNFERAEAGASTAPRPLGEPAGGEPSAQFLKLQDQLIAQYRGEVERLESALRRAQEGQNLITGLIEDQRSTEGKWQQALEAQAEKIANRLASRHDEQLKRLEARHDKETAQLKRLLIAERNKSFWSKLFG